MSIKQFPGGIVTKNPTAPTTAAAKGIWTLAQASDFVKQGIWPRSPGAPTIGTATTSTPTTASVPFTAPSDLGTGAVTFTATSSPSGITGTGASPITVSGLSTGTAYTFTVTASTPGGTGPASAASNSVTPALPAIGSAFGGGFFAGQISTVTPNVASFNLVVGPLASAQSQLEWKNANTATPGANSTIDGPQNTADMVADGNATVYPCAHFCNNLSTGGQTDWYMPAKDELEICYYNLKPDTTSNSTSSGTNTNAVPSRGSSYTAGTPAQTSAAAFQTGGAEAFNATGTVAQNTYWCSTESVVATLAQEQEFSTGYQNYFRAKTGSYKVRAIRRVAV